MVLMGASAPFLFPWSPGQRDNSRDEVVGEAQVGLLAWDGVVTWILSPQKAAPAASKSLLEILNLGSHPRPTESEREL